MKHFSSVCILTMVIMLSRASEINAAGGTPPFTCVECDCVVGGPYGGEDLEHYYAQSETSGDECTSGADCIPCGENMFWDCSAQTYEDGPYEDSGTAQVVCNMVCGVDCVGEGREELALLPQLVATAAARDIAAIIHAAKGKLFVNPVRSAIQGSGCAGIMYHLSIPPALAGSVRTELAALD